MLSKKACSWRTNANFNHLGSEIDTLDGKLTSLQSDVAARAQTSEVNANFNHLGSEIDTLDGKVTSLQNDVTSLQTAGACLPVSQYHSFNISPSPQLPGTQINISGRAFRIVRLRFTELGSGEPYSLTLPVDDPLTHYTQINIAHDVSTLCQTNEISGYPAAVQYTDGRSVTLNPSSSRLESYVYGYLYLRIQIGESLVTISMPTGQSEQSINYDATADTANFDFGNELTNQPHPDNLAAGIDEFLDYIVIEKL